MRLNNTKIRRSTGGKSSLEEVARKVAWVAVRKESVIYRHIALTLSDILRKIFVDMGTAQKDTRIVQNSRLKSKYLDFSSMLFTKIAFHFNRRVTM